jgi:predicted O-methyltransferase YrrM
MIRIMRPDVSGQQGLIDICNYIKKNVDVQKMAEVGSYAGQSTLIFYQNLENLKELYAVDPYSLQYNTDNLFNTNNVEEIYKTFLNNISPYSAIKHIRMSSEDGAKQFENDYFDFVYVDGCHKYESVIKDIESWKPKIKNGGYLSFHDADFSSVITAVSKYFKLDDGFMSIDNSITFKVEK